MAVTSLWRIKGRIGKVILYAENEEKTTVATSIDTVNDTPFEQLNAVINYTERGNATDISRLVDGINCNPFNASEEMIKVKNQFGKTGGTIAYHGYQSFAENEITPEIAHDIGMKTANELWGNKYQIVVTTHIDKKSHYHNHFVINTVSFVDGKKFHRTKEDYDKMREVSDRLCREYGLSVIENPQPSVKKNYAEYTAERNEDFTKNSIIKKDIDECITLAFSFGDFVSVMNERGYVFDFNRKYTTIKHPNFPKARRLKTLGVGYSDEEIERRIKERKRTEYDEPLQDDLEDWFFHDCQDRSVVFVNYRTLFVHFNYGLKRVRNYPDKNRAVQKYLADEILKFDKFTERENLMLDNNLYSFEDVSEFKNNTVVNLNEAIKTKNSLKNKLKSAERMNDEKLIAELKEEIATLSSGIKRMRKEIKICDGIFESKPVIEEKMRILDYEIQKEKEVKECDKNGRSR